MKYEFTNVEKWQMKIRLLEGAQEQLMRNPPTWGTGVCFALGASWHRVDDVVKGRESYLANECDNELHTYVREAIGDHVYLGTWIREKIGEKFDNTDYEKLRRTRIAWLGWMIKCYKQKLKEVV